MDGLITAMNKLQDAFTVLGQSPLDLPQIAVVGGQSAGKSSVLENVVGRDFLPRGSGIVTRRPLVIKLVTARPGQPEVAEFLHLPGTKFVDDWPGVRKAIEDATENDPRCSNKGISNVPINLTIVSPDVLNLTLIDLPGMTRVAVGDQPADINEQIRAMLMHFITQENTIILAVTPANQDLANSDAIQLSKEVDPNGDRTVGVLTKLDLMDKGTDALAILNNEVVPLKLGYIPVVNRSQHDINTKKDIKAQWGEERKYFETHPRYGAIAERCGTQFLSRTLNRTLANSIRECLPELSIKVNAFIETNRAQLGDLEELADPGKRASTVLNSLVEYGGKFQEMIDGRDDDAPFEELAGGAKIASFFKKDFEQSLQNIDVLSDISPRQLRNIIKNSSGLNGGLFIPDEAFQVVIRRAVRMLERPALACVQTVYDELLRQALSIQTSTMARYPSLAQKVRATARSVVAARMDETRTLVKTLIDMEAAFVNTAHPDFKNRMNLQDMVRKESVAVKSQQAQAYETAQRGASTSNPRLTGGLESTSGVLIEGWLEKKGATSVMKRWTRRWVVVKDRVLFYNKMDHEKQEHSNPLMKRSNRPSSAANMSDMTDTHTVTLDSSMVELDSDGKSFTITPQIGKQVHLRCASPEDAQRWVHAVGISKRQDTWDAFIRGKKNEAGHRASVTTRTRTPSAAALTGAGMVRRGGGGAGESKRGGGGGRAGPSASMTDNDILQSRVIETLLEAYFGIIRTKIIDSVPKAITLKLVNAVASRMHSELVGKLYGDPTQIDSLLAETPETEAKRKRLVEVLGLMEQAMGAIQEVQMSPSLSQ